jgi:hypothetical protein
MSALKSASAFLAAAESRRDATEYSPTSFAGAAG